MGSASVLAIAALLATGATARAQEPADQAPSAASGAASDTPAPEAAAPAEPPGPFPIPEGFPEQARLIVIELRGEVSLGTASFVERVASGLEQRDVLVLDINTFGGRVDAAVRIRDALLHARDVGAHTVAWINPRAISAGALISLATDVIAVAPAATMGAATPVQMGQGGDMQPVEEKVVSYMRQEMRATAEARGRDGDIAEAMVDADIEIPGLIDEGKLLTLDGNRLLEWGLASFEANNLDELARELGYGAGEYEEKRVGWSWGEELAGWLSSSLISGLLMTIGMLGLMIGLYSGGSPLPLGLGALCLGLFFFGHHVVNLAGIEDILLFGAGIVLIVVELLIPGNVFAGAVGLVCIIASLVLGLIDFDNVDFSVQWASGLVARALATVFASIIATAVLGYALFKSLPQSRLGRGLLLATAIDSRVGDTDAVEHDALVGTVGVTTTDLRPSGKVKLGERRYEALANTGFIEAGASVRVLKRRGFALVVGRVKDAAPGEDA